ncbi:MAG: hypothetical protein ACYTGQ_18765, partial [Planctomycetota bacterium]
MTKARHNPFRVERLERLAFRHNTPHGVHAPTPILIHDQLIDRFEAQHRRAAIVGPHGSGKTTLLLELANHLQRRGYVSRHVFINLDSTQPDRDTLHEWTRDLTPRHVLLLDGGCHLGLFRWRQLRRELKHANDPGLLITAHTTGRLPTLVRTATTPDLLQALIEKLHPEPLPDHFPDTQQLFARHRGNLRDALRELFDRYAAVEPLVNPNKPKHPERVLPCTPSESLHA